MLFPTTETTDEVKKIIPENDPKYQKYDQKKYERDNLKVEDVLFNGTAKHDLADVLYGIRSGLYCNSINQTDILVNIVKIAIKILRNK
ncbi:hypothetical protein L3K57_15800 (plasmid) [Enterococcus faecium]|uniref:hypothetical protein n=1 Tax=Enterococcus faecium TaxID=1352 RepID=UPI001F2840CE|nr:hypothetical protein [Enterococcus faecium]UJV65268.1 hypothetical protein L3K57_15800 [Enterococcus faecium]